MTGAFKTIEWNLGFSIGEVTEGLETSLNRAGYVYRRTEADDEARFQIALSSGSLRLVVQSLPPHDSPFGSHVSFSRTRLVMIFAGASAEEEAASLRLLTLTFLRAGG